MNLGRLAFTILCTAVWPALLFTLVGITQLFGVEPYDPNFDKIFIAAIWIMMPLIAVWSYAYYRDGEFSRIRATFRARLGSAAICGLLGIIAVGYILVGLTLVSTGTGDGWLAVSLSLVFWGGVIGALGGFLFSTEEEVTW